MVILSHTYESFSSSRIKGKIHAGLIYRQWMKKGSLSSWDPAFTNAQKLFTTICHETDFTLPILSKLVTQDETTKFLIRLHDGYEIESVHIPMKAHNTLCVSSQVGCKMGCTFCETGRMGLLRNLTCDEIVSQVYIARFGLQLAIHNIVFMGMGEPFDNYDAVMQAIKVLTDQNGLAFGMHNITVSTSGRVDEIYRLMDEETISPNLAVSLTGSNPTLRTKLMPITRKHSMEALYDAMKAYCAKTKREILIAYVLLQGVNDADVHADELIRYLEGLNVKVNLIPYNAQTVDRFQPPSQEVVDGFAARLRASRMRVLLRQTKGRSIMAACGQLGKKVALK